MNPVHLSVVIISLNSRGFVRECVESLGCAQWRHWQYEVIVVDNGSTDGTPAMLSREYPHVRVIANGTNVGFCPAGNQGAAIARGRYLLFLNDDTLIIDDAVARLLEWAEEHPSAGMVGSRLLNTDGTDQFSSGRRFSTPAASIFGRRSILTRWFPNASWARAYLMSDHLDSDAPYEVDWLSAAAMMVTRSAFEAAGGLAEDYYYFHEQVFCERVQRAGYRVYLHPRSKIIHHEGLGSGVRTRRVRRRHIWAFHTSALRWFCGHNRIGPYSPVRALAAAALVARAGLLIVIDTFAAEKRVVNPELHGKRPEGGVAL